MDGIYNDAFFGDAKSKPGYQKRIQVVMQNLNLKFANNMARRGHCREITNSKDLSCISEDVIPIIKNKFIDHIQHLIKSTKGRELLETFNHIIISDLFLKQLTP